MLGHLSALEAAPSCASFDALAGVLNVVIVSARKMQMGALPYEAVRRLIDAIAAMNKISAKIDAVERGEAKIHPHELLPVKAGALAADEMLPKISLTHLLVSHLTLLANQP
jgi:hypothetical protein